MKYRVTVGAFCTRLVKRKIIVYANDEKEAKEKAIEKYIIEEMKIPSAIGPGSTEIDNIEVIK